LATANNTVNLESSKSNIPAYSWPV